MSAEKIGSVKSGKGKSCGVFWDSSDKAVYVEHAGRTRVGEASSAASAMKIAEAWLYNK